MPDKNMEPEIERSGALSDQLVTSLVNTIVVQRSVEIEKIGPLIKQVRAEVSRGLADEGVAPEGVKNRTPAVDPADSIFDDYLVCLEDGKHLKMLKRHLETNYGLTPEQYRQKWDLPQNYPMTAPRYSRERSKLALKSGLGLKRAKKSQETGAMDEPSTDATEPGEDGTRLFRILG